MHRDQYLGLHADTTTQGVVDDFVNWLAKHLDDPALFAHRYTERRSGDDWQCLSLFDASQLYQWPPLGASGAQDASLISNSVALNALQKALQTSINPLNDQAAFTAAAAVMKWGGVQAGNVRWLTLNTKGLATTLRATAAALASGNLTDPLLLSPNLRFNAGMTKVYSLLVDDFIIYDSRVAAALGWIVVKYCQHKGLSSVPAQLAFPWAAAKEGPNARSPKNRNPGQRSYSFPRLQAGTAHALWNLKASWILAAALSRNPQSLFVSTAGVPALRRLEAALFMIGYDLQAGRAIEQPATDTPAAVPEGWTECYTAAKGKQFHYRIEDNAVVLLDGRQYPIETINTLLNILQEGAGGNGFPLANSATKVRAQQSPFGIGTAYFEATGQKGNPPASSALAAILQEIGALLYTPGSDAPWSINSSEFSGQGAIDVTPLLQREIKLRDAL